MTLNIKLPDEVGAAAVQKWCEVASDYTRLGESIEAAIIAALEKMVEIGMAEIKTERTSPLANFAAYIDGRIVPSHVTKFLSIRLDAGEKHE